MLEDLEEDTHMCIKCSSTIVGLENYVQHRKNHCNKIVSSAASLNREIIGTNHSYRSFEFTEPPSAKDGKQFNFNYEIESVHQDDPHDDVVSNAGILPSPIHQKASDYKTDPNKSLSESYDYNYGLGADVFFSSLNLQSSSKMKTQTVATNISGGEASCLRTLMKSDDKMLQRKQSDPGSLSHTEHMDDWINSGASTSGTDKLMKAVNAISGTKKLAYDSPHYNYEYTHGSPEHAYLDDDDDEDDEIVEDADLVEDDIPPHNHTGGKWKPSERNRSMHTASRWYERWDISEENNPSHLDSGATGSHEELDEYNPPPSHTKGKWVPGTKIIKLDYKHKERHDSESFSEQFWCRSCNRKLSSRIVYERHLKSKLHTKRSQPENDLEQASLPLPSIEEIVGKRATNTDTQAKRNRKRKAEIACITEHPFGAIKKRNRRFNYIKCGVCKTRLRTFLYGKHLISHYHYRRMFKNPTESYATILDNIDRIIMQSPYQCQPCRFYANTEDMFLCHWNSVEHLEAVSVGEGTFWCAFCKFTCKTNDEMHLHLVEKDHQEVVMAINRSVPIIIRKKLQIQCDKCKTEFSYNIELRKHSLNCSGSALGTASDRYQGKHYCVKCNKYFQSVVSFQRHATTVHSTKSYFCGPCEMSFTEIEAAKRHRVSAEHKVKAARIKAKKSLKRKCTVCDEILDDLIMLKAHLKEHHPDHNYSCYFCGQKFTLSQELSRHIRDKVCKTDDEGQMHVCNESESLSTISLLDLPIITEISQDTEVPKLIVAPQNHTHSSTSVVADSVVENYMIIETAAELNVNEESQLKDGKDHSSDTEHPILWGCKQCDFRTPTEAECIFHEMLHKWNICNDSKIPCPICNRTFGKNSLRCHLRLHTNERIFQCDQCELKFTRKANLKEHVQRIHLKKVTQKKPKPIANQLSQKSSSSPQNEQLFECSICQKKFRKKSLLEQHMHCHREMVSVNVRVFECPEKDCLFSGRSAAELRVHQSTHSNEKKYYCWVENCGYKTKTKTLLNRHIKSQHEDNSTQQLCCPHCDFSTKVSSHLKRHVRIHTGEKPFTCPHCDYVSNNPENLRKHVIKTNKHPGRFLYECKYCIDANEIQPFATNNTKEYKCHLVSVHKKKE